MTPMECERIERQVREATRVGPFGWLLYGVALVLAATGSVYIAAAGG